MILKRCMYKNRTMFCNTISYIYINTNIITIKYIKALKIKGNKKNEASKI